MRAFLFALSLLPTLAQASANSHALYEAIPGPAYGVEYRQGGAPIVGTAILEKESAELVCQRMQGTAPGSPANYLCWEKIFAGEEARLTFEGSDAFTLDLTYSIDGQPVSEGQIRQRGLPSGFCRERRPPGEAPGYLCYNRVP